HGSVAVSRSDTRRFQTPKQEGSFPEQLGAKSGPGFEVSHETSRRRNADVIVVCVCVCERARLWSTLQCRLTLNASGLLFSAAPDCQRQRRFSRSSSGCLSTPPQNSRILLAPAYMFRASAFVRTRDAHVSSSRVTAVLLYRLPPFQRLRPSQRRAAWPLLPARLCVRARPSARRSRSVGDDPDPAQDGSGDRRSRQYRNLRSFYNRRCRLKSACRSDPLGAALGATPWRSCSNSTTTPPWVFEASRACAARDAWPDGARVRARRMM
ncbi:hypothetical protein MRX96_050123, partial [Rhipicephalus microplus]